MNSENVLKITSVLLLVFAFVCFFMLYYDDSVSRIKEKGKLTVVKKKDKKKR